jgi:hypothetical protein
MPATTMISKPYPTPQKMFSPVQQQEEQARNELPPPQLSQSVRSSKKRKIHEISSSSMDEDENRQWSEHMAQPSSRAKMRKLNPQSPDQQVLAPHTSFDFQEAQ